MIRFKVSPSVTAAAVPTGAGFAGLTRRCVAFRKRKGGPLRCKKFKKGKGTPVCDSRLVKKRRCPVKR